MIRLHTLGTIALADETGTELTRVLRQPKRFALLAYLALARPRGFQRRDMLLGLFWPELDADRARAALRQALYTLRLSLPDGVLETRGDEEVGVPSGALWCDVHEFERALREGRPAEALELYRGDLLEGFHVPGASPDLDYWVSGERERLKGKALQAARDAEAAAERTGDLTGALGIAQRAASLAPLDEDVARRRMELLHRTGDNVAAVLVYERWSARLREELDVEPSPEMRAFVEALRHPAEKSGDGGDRASLRPITTAPPSDRQIEPAAEGERVEATASSEPLVGPPRDAPMDTPSGTPRGRDPGYRILPRWALVVTVLLMLGLVVAVAPLQYWWQSTPEAPGPQRVIVLPFAYRGGAESSYLSEGLVYLFSVALDGGDLRSVDPHTLVRRAAEYRAGDYDPESAADLAGRLGADFFVLGDVVETETGLQMTGRLYERERGGAVPRGASTASGPIADLPRLVDQVAREILAQHPGSSISRMSRLAAVTTPSLPGLKAYLRGERLLREARFSDAITAFQSAVEADTLFALAHYRMSLAASWAFRAELASSAAARAAVLADRLPERERRLLLAHHAYRRGEAAESAAMLRSLTEDYPEDPEVWYRLGEVLMHFGPPNGWSILEAADPFRRAVELEPLLAEVQYHLAQIEASAGRRDSALARVREALEIAPDGSRAPQLRVLRTALDPEEDGWADRLRELDAADDFTVVSATYNATLYVGELERGLEIAALLVRRSRPVETRVFGHLLLAELELALGRGDRARAQIGRMRAIDPVSADRFEALLMEAPAAAPSREALQALATRLEGAVPRAESVSHTSSWRPEEPNPALAHHYAAGRLSGLLGDAQGLDRAAGALRAVPGDTLLGASLARDLELLREPADDPHAARAWGPAALHVPVEVAVLSPVYSRPAHRYGYARALEAEGRLGEALAWYEALATFSVHDLPWGIPALADRARIHEALGDSDMAASLERRLHGLRAGALPHGRYAPTLIGDRAYSRRP